MTSEEKAARRYRDALEKGEEPGPRTAANQALLAQVKREMQGGGSNTKEEDVVQPLSNAVPGVQDLHFMDEDVESLHDDTDVPDALADANRRKPDSLAEKTGFTRITQRPPSARSSTASETSC